MSTELPIAYLARHGDTAWTMSGQYASCIDLPLVPEGEQEALHLGERLKRMHFIKVFCSPPKVHEWLATAESVPGFIGFAVGRTCLWNPLVNWRAEKISRDAAASEVGRRCSEFANIFFETRNVVAPLNGAPVKFGATNLRNRFRPAGSRSGDELSRSRQAGELNACECRE